MLGRAVALTVCLWSTLANSLNLIRCTADDSCERAMATLQASYTGVMRCRRYRNEEELSCAEVDNRGKVKFISIADCTGDEACQRVYPDFPICNRATGACQPVGGDSRVDQTGNCRLNSDCNFREICEKGRCVKNDNVATTSRPSQCAYSSDCRKRENAKAVCVKRKCKYIQLNCLYDSHCNDDMTCSKGKCVQVGCRSNQDCKIGTKDDIYMCHNKNCVQSLDCTNTNDCKRRHGRAYTCTKGRCQKKLEKDLS